MEYLAEVNKVIIKDDIDRARQLSCWSLLWHLLDAESLVVTIDRETELCLKWIPILVLKIGVKISNIQSHFFPW